MKFKLTKVKQPVGIELDRVGIADSKIQQPKIPLTVHRILKQSPTLVYMDGLNYFNNLYSSKSNVWDLKLFKLKVAAMVQGMRRANYSLTVFIDASRISAEAKTKSKTRNELKIRKEAAGSPANKECLLGDAFKAVGIPVYYSFESDNDDTLSAYAQRDKAAILSSDQDFFRYIGREYEIFTDYKIRKGVLTLIPAVMNPKRSISKRELIGIPKTITHSPDLADLYKGYYREGPNTPLIKLMGNPILAARPLRQAMYHRLRLGLEDGITEIIPSWVDGDVSWSLDVVHPDSTMDNYLDQPKLAANLLFKDHHFVRPADVSDSAWNFHVNACYSIVCNLCAMCSGGRESLLSLLSSLSEEFLQIDKYDISFRCRSCGKLSGLSKSEAEWFYNKGHSIPKSCKYCLNK